MRLDADQQSAAAIRSAERPFSEDHINYYIDARNALLKALAI